MNDFLYGWNAYIRKTFHSGSTPFPQCNVNYKGNKKIWNIAKVWETGKKDCFVRCVNEKINGENKTENGGSIVK